MSTIKSTLFNFLLLTVLSCNSTKNIGDYWNYNIPSKDFNDSIKYHPIDYSDADNWMFYADKDDALKILPKNYKDEKDSLHDVSVFYIHPTTLYDGTSWNADTSFFRNNKLLRLCLENQASVFAGLTKLYAPHYREMHIYSYTDTINGIKAFNIAYNDIEKSFKYFLKNKKTDKFIIAAHSQGTNHAKKLINEYIYTKVDVRRELIMSYLIGMDINKNEMLIDLCQNPIQLNCFLNWRSFNESYYPNDWNYGENYISTNPITYTNDTLWSDKKQHDGILFPNQKIFLKRSISVRNEKGLLWISFDNNLILNNFKKKSYHNADFNLFWVNIRQNLIKRLEHVY